MRSFVLLFLACVACGFPRPEHIGDDAAVSDAAMSDAGMSDAPTSDAATPDAAPADFVIALSTPRLHVVAGSSATAGVTISRNTFTDAVDVTVAGLPSGVSADALTIVGDTGTLTLHAAADAKQGDAALTITAMSAGRSHDAPLSLLAMGLPGTLDKSFGVAGNLATVLGTANALAIQPDRNVVVAGEVYRSSQDIFVARYLPEGTPDPGFSGGIVFVDSGGKTDATRALALQSDGKLVVVGSFGVGATRIGLVLRFKSDGSPDTDFGTGGRVELMLNAAGDPVDTSLNAVAIQADGSIVVAGGVAGPQQGYIAVVARITSTGLLDSGFGTDSGSVTVRFSTPINLFNALAIQPDGRIVAAGNGLQQDNPSLPIFARLTTRGRLDGSFSNDGQLQLGATDKLRNLASIVLQPDGKIVVAGYGDGPSLGTSACLVRLNGSDGSPDTGFGSNGTLIANLSNRHNESIGGLAVQADGKFAISGLFQNETQSQQGLQSRSAVLARISGAGLDPTFAGGVVTSDLSRGVDGVYNSFNALAIDSDGRLVVAGVYDEGDGLGGPDEKATLARYWP
jgi:uncharacterized delta-60 repeat protein